MKKWYQLIITSLFIISSTSSYSEDNNDLINSLNQITAPYSNQEKSECLKTASTMTEKPDYAYILINTLKCTYSESDLKNEQQLFFIATYSTILAEKYTTLPNIAKLDIAKIKDQDSYGRPRWDTIEKIAHIELKVDQLKSLLKQEVKPTIEELKGSIIVLSTN